MEVDEAANHIKDLVDPDANIIWGSAFNNDLEGKIRVSVVATGIDADAASIQAAPAKVFAFPTAARGAEAPRPMPVPEPVIESEVAEEIAPAEAEMPFEEEATAAEIGLDKPMVADAGNELLLGHCEMLGGGGTGEGDADIMS